LILKLAEISNFFWAPCISGEYVRRHAELVDANTQVLLDVGIKIVVVRKDDFHNVRWLWHEISPSDEGSAMVRVLMNHRLELGQFGTALVWIGWAA
jgi:hypothetical protein